MAIGNTTERVKAFMRYFHNDYGYFEGITGVRASKWRDLSREKTKAVTAEMIDELCRYWPEFAYWFVTGDDASGRGQTSPAGYFGLEYGTLYVLVPNGCDMWRDESGQLCPDLGSTTIKNKASKEYEVSVAQRILYFSAVANEYNAASLAPKFWDEFIRPLSNGEKLVMADSELKKWVNQFPIVLEPGEESKKGFSYMT